MFGKGIGQVKQAPLNVLICFKITIPIQRHTPLAVSYSHKVHVIVILSLSITHYFNSYSVMKGISAYVIVIAICVGYSGFVYSFKEEQDKEDSSAFLRILHVLARAEFIPTDIMKFL